MEVKLLSFTKIDAYANNKAFYSSLTFVALGSFIKMNKVFSSVYTTIGQNNILTKVFAIFDIKSFISSVDLMYLSALITLTAIIIHRISFAYYNFSMKISDNIGSVSTNYSCARLYVISIDSNKGFTKHIQKIQNQNELINAISHFKSKDPSDYTVMEQSELLNLNKILHSYNSYRDENVGGFVKLLFIVLILISMLLTSIAIIDSIVVTVAEILSRVEILVTPPPAQTYPHPPAPYR